MQQARDQRLIRKSFLERTLLDRFQVLGLNPNVETAIFLDVALAERLYRLKTRLGARADRPRRAQRSREFPSRQFPAS